MVIFIKFFKIFINLLKIKNFWIVGFSMRFYKLGKPDFGNIKIIRFLSMSELSSFWWFYTHLTDYLFSYYAMKKVLQFDTFKGVKTFFLNTYDRHTNSVHWSSVISGNVKKKKVHSRLLLHGQILAFSI